MSPTTRTATDQGESGNRFEAPEQYARYDVRDPLNRKIGSVQKLFVNDSGEPEYVKVKMGLLGFKTVLIPVTFARIDNERRILMLQ